MKKLRERVAMWLAWQWAKNVMGDLCHVDELTEAEMQYAYKIDQLKEALIWCSGSADFGPEGKARKGWLKLCQPLLG